MFSIVAGVNEITRLRKFKVANAYLNYFLSMILVRPINLLHSQFLQTSDHRQARLRLNLTDVHQELMRIVHFYFLQRTIRALIYDSIFSLYAVELNNVVQS